MLLFTLNNSNKTFMSMHSWISVKQNETANFGLEVWSQMTENDASAASSSESEAPDDSVPAIQRIVHMTKSMFGLIQSAMTCSNYTISDQLRFVNDLQLLTKQSKSRLSELLYRADSLKNFKICLGNLYEFCVISFHFFSFLFISVHQSKCFQKR